MSKCVNGVIGTEGMVGLETVTPNPKASDMTLRDHFAGLAVQGAIACAFLSEDVSEDDYAMWAYRYADAMMRERSK